MSVQHGTCPLSDDNIQKQMQAELASTATPFNPSMRVTVYLGEAQGLRDLAFVHWLAQIIGDETKIAGFESLLEAQILDEIDWLIDEISKAEADRLLANGASQRAALLNEAREKCAVLQLMLAWLARKDEDLAAQLEGLRQRERDFGQTPADWAGRLELRVALGRAYSVKLEGVGGYEVSELERFEPLAEALRGLPSTRESPVRKRKLLGMLAKRLQTLREAGRIVFRKVPTLRDQLPSKALRLRAARNGRGPEPEPEFEIAVDVGND